MSTPFDQNRAVRQVRSGIVVIGALCFTVSLGLAAVDHYRSASNTPAAGSEVLADLVPSVERALRELESADRRLAEDPVLLPAALTTASGLSEDSERLDEDLRRLNSWTEDLTRLDEQMEKSLVAARIDERSKAILRRQWTSLKRKWEGRLWRLHDAHLEWINAVASVHLFMEKRLGHTSIDGETVVFETDDEVREFSQLMHGVAVAAQRIVSASEQCKVAMKAVTEAVS
jgi:hypothetical protein